MSADEVTVAQTKTRDGEGRLLIRVIPRCEDCGNLYCARGGGLESLMSCPAYESGVKVRDRNGRPIAPDFRRAARSHARRTR